MRPVEHLKREVFSLIGEACVYCGRVDDLQVNHKDGRPWAIRRFNQAQRWWRYFLEALAGLVEPACGRCNRKRGGHLRYETKDKARQGAPRRKAA